MADDGIKREFSFRDLAVMSPAFAGAGVSAYRVGRSLPAAFRQATVGKSPVSEFIKDISPYAQSVLGQEAKVQEFIDYATNLTQVSMESGLLGTQIRQSSLGPDEIVSAWSRAASELPSPFVGAIDPSGAASPFASMRNIFAEHLPRFGPAHQARFMTVFRANVESLRRQQMRLGDKYNLAAFSPASIQIGSPEEFLTTTLRGPEDLPLKLRSYGQRISETLGGLDIAWRTKPEWRESGLGAWEFSLGKELGMSVPRSRSGTILSGETLSSRFAIGEFGIWDDASKNFSRMSSEEYALHRFERDILPRLAPGAERPFGSTREAQRAIKALSRSIQERAEYVPSAPAAFQEAQTKGFAKIRGSVVHMVTPEGKTLTATQALRIPELRELVGKELFPGSVSPASMAKGTLATTDIREMFRMGEVAPEARNLYQGFREWGVAAGEQPARSTDAFDWLFSPKMREAYGETPALLHRTVFVKEGELKAAQARTPVDLSMMAGEGEWEITKALDDYAAGVRDKSVKLHQMNTEIANQFVEKGGVGYAKSVNTLPAGTMVGWHRGMPVELSNPVRLKGYTKHGSFMQLHLQETATIGQLEKAFGLKGSMLRRGGEVFEETAKAMGLSFVPESRIPANLLKKEPHYLAMQMTSALWQQVRTLPTERTTALRGFIANPGGVMERLGTKNMAQYSGQMMQIAMEAGLGAEQFGRVFGGVPIYLGEDWASKVGLDLPRGHVQKAEFLSPVEAIFTTFGGTRSERFTVGGRASIEPRLFGLLRAGQFGEFGEDLASEFGRRVAMDNPAAITASEEVRRTLVSFAGGGDPSWAGRTFAPGKRLDYAKFETFMEGGGWLDVGAGKSKVYVPGMEKVRTLIPFDLPDGKRSYSDFAASYVKLARSAADLQAGKITSAEFLAEGGPYLGAMRTIQKEQAIFGKGVLGLARGGTQRVTGSRWLQIASSVGAGEVEEKAFTKKAGLFDVGISDYWFEKMLAEQAQIDQGAAKALRKRWLTGENVGGMFFRHPFIGEFSAMPVSFHRMMGAGKEALALVPERNIELFGRSVSLSPLAAVLGDKDADFAGFMLLGGDLEKNARSWVRNSGNESTQRYIDHLVQVQLLKPKAQGAAAEMEQLTLKQLSEVAVEKLGLPKQEVPKISLTMSRAKRAVAAMGDDPRAQSALTMLTIGEQTPIAGKHISAMELSKNIGALEATFEGIRGALETGNAREIEYFFRETLGKKAAEDDVIQGLLRGGLKLTTGEQAALSKTLGGIAVADTIGGLNLRESSEFLAEAMERYAGMPQSRMDDLMSGRAAGASISEIGKYAQAARVEITKINSNIIREGFQKVASQARLATQNVLGAGGKRIIKHAKPLMWGTAAAVGLAAFLSSPDEMTGSGANFSAMDRGMSDPSGAGRASGMKPEDIMPPQQIMGSPTIPQSFASPSVRIGSNMGYNVNAHVSMDGGAIDPAGLGQQVEMAVGHADRVNLHILDRRRTMNVDQLLNDMD